MKKIEINNYFENFPLEPEAQMALLEKYHQRYPASHFVTFFYLKMLQERTPKKYDELKSKLLLSILNRSEFHNCKLEYFTANEVQEENIDEIAVLAAQLQQNIPKIKFDPEKHNADMNLAESGETEDIEFISETLAIVYAAQGYTGKAVKIIKKLMLQNPEKNTYFAALIETLKKSVNQSKNLEESNH
ncbi:MAG: hypothetical protein FWF70_04385 [Bacteroidetes bacterium]|nr:hypothetical protein [Bacteroidota bacterium]MCL1968315.1 hypothetical protein [Bacteroidota bacterium]